jgi:hypothetical protein
MIYTPGQLVSENTTALAGRQGQKQQGTTLEVAKSALSVMAFHSY